MSKQTTASLQKRNLQVTLTTGSSANGTAKTTTRTFSNINNEATAQAMNHTATQIASLLDETSTGVYYTDKYLLIEAEVEA